MEIVTGLTEEAHVTPIDDAVRNTNLGYYTDRVVFDTFRALEAVAITANEVRVYGGYGMNQGRIFKIDEAEYDSVTIENGSQGVKRADLIVAKYTMDSQTGFEDISLAVIKGQSGQVYTDPTYTTGNMNEGATEDDFPLYRVKINGIVIEAVEPLFTPLPTGGRLGLVEEKIDDHIADTENPHDIAWAEAKELTAMSAADTLAVQFGKIAKAITSLIAHIADKSNPHEVSGTQLTGAVPISKGGTGATTAAQALANLGVPDDVAKAMSKETYTDTATDTIKVSKGGTGKTSVTAGSVLVGNGTSAMTERSIDSTSGGTSESNALITSGAVKSKITEMQTTFQAGVDAVYNAVVAEGITPSASTPEAIATAIATIRNGGTATAAQILSGKTAYVSKSLLTGTMTNRGAWTGATTGSGNVAIPAGYHNGSGYVSGSGAYNAGRNQGRADAGNWYVDSTGIIGAGVTRAVTNHYFYALAINTVSYSSGATFSISGANAIGYQAFSNNEGYGWLIYIKTTSSSLNISVSGAGNSMYVLSRLGPAS